ncbi:hypothetical protein WJX82_002436 [Trebouxia sp. C0006]
MDLQTSAAFEDEQARWVAPQHALQTCSGQTNRTQYLNSAASGYQCYGPSEPTEAVIVSIYEGLQPRQVAALRNNRAAYSERHGYRYCEFNSRPDPTRGASWNKIAASLLVVHCSQYVLALDSDAVIVNYNLGIRDIFQEHGKSKDILFSKDYGGNSIINAGSMLIKRSKWSVWFLQHLYNEHRVWQQGGQKGQEQGAINQFAEEHSFHFSQHTGIVPYEVFNNHRLRYEPGTFVAHYAGWGSSRERYDRIADELDDPNAMWSEFSEDSVAANNATRQFCTEALTIQAPHERMTDRLIRSLSTGKARGQGQLSSQGYRALESSLELVVSYTLSPRSPYTRTLSCSTPAMSGTIHNPIRGPYTKQAFGKFLHKGEDAWLQQPKLLWKPKSDSKGVSIGYDVFGVFDGHGGKQAANFAAKHVLLTLQEELADDALVQQLPAALVNTFRKVQEQFHENTQVSGATATVAVVVGWDLVVASVGDSTAYLDTGAEVVQVSDTHRLDDNKAERKRCEAAGSEVCKSTVDGKPVGPDRVWPGGLAMSRTIGDYMAGDVVLPEPEVRRVALPSKGARLIIASDGLWDAVNPKTAAHHVRGMQAGKAAGELVQAALKSKGLRDDITVLVIDAMPDDSFRLPPFLAKQNGGYAVTLEDVGSVDWHKPLDEAAAADACASNTWQRRTAAVQAQFKLTHAADSDHSSDTNAADLQSACSDSAADSAAFETPYMSPEPLLEENSSEWETVPVKPKREVPTTASASMPDGWAEEESSQGVEAGVGHRGVAVQAILVKAGTMAIQILVPLPQ